MTSMNHLAPSWGRFEKIRFLLSYIWAKLAVLWEVKNHPWQFLFFECKYSFGNFLNYFLGPDWISIAWRGQALLDTRWGKFEVRPDTQDASILSPAFERADWNYLLKLCRKHFQRRQKIVFVDIGAHVGRFSVALAKEFRNEPLKILAFEPDPKNQSAFRHHMELNQLTSEQIVLYGQALGAQIERRPLFGNSIQPGNNSMIQAIDARHQPLGEVDVSPLDDFLTLLPKDTVVFLKIDVEGFEREVLSGSTQALKHFTSVIICVEDMYHREELYSSLTRLEAKPICKLTSYNSWWQK